MNYELIRDANNLGVMYGRSRPLSLQVEASTTPLIDADLLKVHCSIDGSVFDDLLDLYQQIAIRWAEDVMKRTILSRSHILTLSDFPRTTYPPLMLLPRGTTRAIESIAYQSGGQENTLRGATSTTVGADYIEDLRGENGGRITPNVGQSWPSVDCDHVSPVRITFTAGWASADVVPAPIKHAVMVAVSDCFEFRGSADMQTQLYLGGKGFDARTAMLSSYVVTRLGY